MSGAILCLDSGTTAVKAAAFTADGRLIAIEEVANGALRRDGRRVEQDMAATRADAFGVLARCAARLETAASALIVTGQGDGLWPLDARGEPCGRAITWLDGRAAPLVAEFAANGTLARVVEITLSRPTAASQALQLVWMSRHEPERFAAIAHALRCKEWLFFGLTGCLVSEPSTMMATWGDWRRQRLSEDIPRAFGLAGFDFAPPMQPLRETVRPLSEAAARVLGLSPGLPVLLGPSDAQATAIGLGVGVRDGIGRASLFGTSAIHACHMTDLAGIVAEPPGAMLQPFPEPGEFLRIHPSFNGTTAFAHVERLAGAGRPIGPAPSGVVVHPFFETGGERAPVTDGDAKATLFGLTASTTPAEIAWAAREALAFVARMSHDLMGRGDSAVALGGGLAADRDFAQLLATALGRTVLRSTAAHAGLVGLGLIAAWATAGGKLKDGADAWLGAPADVVEPEAGPTAAYVERKFTMFCRLMEAVRPLWPDLSALAASAAHQPTMSVTS